MSFRLRLAVNLQLRVDGCNKICTVLALQKMGPNNCCMSSVALRSGREATERPRHSPLSTSTHNLEEMGSWLAKRCHLNSRSQRATTIVIRARPPPPERGAEFSLDFKERQHTIALTLSWNDSLRPQADLFHPKIFR